MGVKCETVANPAIAGTMNVLPGFGDIYLATGNGANSSNWGAFVLDLLLWPYSVVWAVPQGVITAGDVNKKECAGYYMYTADGKARLEKLRQEQKVVADVPVEEGVNKN